MTSDEQPLPANDCLSMADVRSGVDAIDQALVAMIARRFAYMDAAARIKSDRNIVRDEARKRAVLDNVIAAARTHNVPVELAEQLWDTLVEASIAYELDRWDDLRA
ncbi:MAG: chorismate mutase [Sphingorhabdus sp.]